MASRVTRQATKRKHAASGQVPEGDAPDKMDTEDPLEKEAWQGSLGDEEEDDCFVTLDPSSGTASFHAKIRRRAPPPEPHPGPAHTTKSMLLTNNRPVTSDPGQDKARELTLTALGNFDIFEPDAVSDDAPVATASPRTTMRGAREPGESDLSMRSDRECSKHGANSSLTEEDEELGIDPNLLRLGLERSRSLGDATRVHDANKQRILKGVKTKKRKRKGLEKGDDPLIGVGPGGLGEDSGDRKAKRLAPNFFVAIQVSNAEIHEALRDVQQTVVTGDEKLKDAMVPIATLHLTIMVMHLATDEDVERAKVALNECHRLLSPRFTGEKLNIMFGGLGHFNNQVMFAKIKDQDNILESLYEIADTVEKCFSDYQLVSTGERGFKPHLTVMKLSRAPSLRKKGVRRIKSELYKTHSAQVFGTQVVNGLQLCSINKPKTADGYYSKAAEVMFGEPTLEPCRDIHPITEGDEPLASVTTHQNTTQDLPGFPDGQLKADEEIVGDQTDTDTGRQGTPSTDENRNVPVAGKDPTLSRPELIDEMNSGDDSASNVNQSQCQSNGVGLETTPVTVTPTCDNASDCPTSKPTDGVPRDASNSIHPGSQSDASAERLSEPPLDDSRGSQEPQKPPSQITGDDKLKELIPEDRPEDSPPNSPISSPETS